MTSNRVTYSHSPLPQAATRCSASNCPATRCSAAIHAAGATRRAVTGRAAATTSRVASAARRAVRRAYMHFVSVFAYVALLATLLTSCIEPPLKLPAQEVLVDLPLVFVDLDVVWNLDIDWRSQWYYDWDEKDKELWGELAYPLPTNYEVRRYFLGSQTGAPHTTVDGFTIYGTHFRRTYEFGYYDMLIWSNIDSKDGTQVVTINENDLDEVMASTTVTRGMSRVAAATVLSPNYAMLVGAGHASSNVVTGLYNQPEIFYAAYPQDTYISRNQSDYDHYDEVERCWVKQINCELDPRVYLYLVQVIIKNNDGRIVGCTGDNAISSFSSGTSVNTGHTWDNPVLVYFGTRFKQNMDYEGETVDIIGGKFTTYGLCDMGSYSQTKSGPHYTGTRTDLKNYLYVDLKFSNQAQATLQVDVTDQCLEQAHGGIITVVLDAHDIDIPPAPEPGGTGSLFVPTVEDYDEVIYDIQI
ncbi:MAG: hypothetical protein MJZ35_00190 [Bacteroidaceae bacterium]|nr:hypothetical protein [Bacteroidaceae bacterium]